MSQTFLLDSDQLTGLISEIASGIDYELWLNDSQRGTCTFYGFTFGAEFQAKSYQKLVTEELDSHQAAAVACRIPG